jgi:hypothetical protein
MCAHVRHVRSVNLRSNERRRLFESMLLMPHNDGHVLGHCSNNKNTDDDGAPPISCEGYESTDEERA